MNASCLVFLYSWKESKRGVGRRFPLLYSLGALSVWALPFIDPRGGALPGIFKGDVLMDLLLAPLTSAFIVVLLFGGIAIHSLAQFVGRESLLSSVMPPAMNFGATALLLKALSQFAEGAVREPSRVDLWVPVPLICALLLGVRNVAARPLRRAMEIHDNLCVLACYGAISSLTAAVVGVFIFDEFGGWEPWQKATSTGLVLLHCWSIQELGKFGDVKGASKKHDREIPRGKDAATDKNCFTKEAGRRMADPAKGSSPKIEMKSATHFVHGDRGIRGPSSSEPPSGNELLNFNSEPRTVEQDAQIEDELFARALAPARLSSVVTGMPVVDDGGGLEMLRNAAEGDCFFQEATDLTPKFDADFEEIMRRFDEDDAADIGPGVRPVLDLGGGNDEASPRPAHVHESNMGQILQFDAGALLEDDADIQDEEELVRNIQNLESL